MAWNSGTIQTKRGNVVRYSTSILESWIPMNSHWQLFLQYGSKFASNWDHAEISRNLSTSPILESDELPKTWTHVWPQAYMIYMDVYYLWSWWLFKTCTNIYQTLPTFRCRIDSLVPLIQNFGFSPGRKRTTGWIWFKSKGSSRLASPAMSPAGAMVWLDINRDVARIPIFHSYYDECVYLIVIILS